MGVKGPSSRLTCASKPSSARAMWVVIPLLVLAAAYLAIDKPFGAAGTAP